MTTIVVDSEMGYMAADCMATSNDCEVAIECPKIKRMKNVGLVASSGHEGPSQMVEEWLEYGDWDNPLDPIDISDDADFTTVVLTEDYEIMIVDRFCRPYIVNHRWYATGTGGVFAWPILEAGCGIEKAMNTAIRLDNNSGFGYDLEYLNEDR